MEFFFEGRNECKNFWKKCVENHGFFRCSVVKRVVRQKTRVLSRGSSFRYVIFLSRETKTKHVLYLITCSCKRKFVDFWVIRYSGKTQKQIVEFVRDNYVKRQTFQR